jgi:hypothetical protein
MASPAFHPDEASRSSSVIQSHPKARAKRAQEDWGLVPQEGSISIPVRTEKASHCRFVQEDPLLLEADEETPERVSGLQCEAKKSTRKCWVFNRLLLWIMFLLNICPTLGISERHAGTAYTRGVYQLYDYDDDGMGGYEKPSHALITGQAMPGTAGESLQIQPRSIDQWTLTDVLLVSTIDGSLHARDRKTGLEVWSIPGDGPLVQVATSDSLLSKDADENPKFDEDRDITWIVEPLGDGVLYYFMPSTGLQRLPVSIKQLVLESPFAIHGDDKVYTGSRQTILYSINATTGDILKVYGAKTKNGGLGKAICKPKRMGLEYDDDELDDDYDYLTWEDNGSFMIGRTGMFFYFFCFFFVF